MATYSHATFTARSSREFRTAMVAAIRADHAIDAQRGCLLDAKGEETQDSRGHVIHTLTANGRTIAYDATINDGRLTIHDMAAFAEGTHYANRGSMGIIDQQKVRDRIFARRYPGIFDFGAN